MSFLDSLFKRGWSLDGVAAPWGDRPSLHDFIKSRLDPDTGRLTAQGVALPDEKPREGGVSWAPGALDGVLGHHVAPGEGDGDAAVSRAADALVALLERATSERAAALYAALTADGALSLVDPLVAALATRQDVDAERLHAVARWLATGAADRDPVKVAIALLGALRAVGERDVVTTFARHEEFTLYAIVALQNMSGDVPHDRVLLDVARHVDGWGRVHCVERLDGSSDDEVRAWMLREGYRNDIMWEYTALACARTGGLLEALRLPQPDDALLMGAGDLLTTLMNHGGPAEAIESYPDGAEATSLFLRHLAARETLPLAHLLHAQSIRRFLVEENDESPARDEALGWPARRDELLALADDVIARPSWRALVLEELEHPDRERFWNAATAAKSLGIDPWERFFARTAAGEDFWWNLTSELTPARAVRVVGLAERTLPLAEIAAAPADPPPGPTWVASMALATVVQALGRYAGLGWPLLRASLRSGAPRNQLPALGSLSAWPRGMWPEDAEALVEAIAANEAADPEARDRARRVLAGERF